MYKKLYVLALLFLIQTCVFAQQQTISYSVNPTAFNEDQSVTLTIDGTSINEGTWGVSNNALYIWAWSFDTATNTIMDAPTNGAWTASNAANKLTYNSTTDKYTYTFVPNTFFNRTGINRMGFLIKAQDGSGDKKSQDNLLNIGAFQFTTQNPKKGSTTFVASGGSYPIQYQTSTLANWVLKKNGAVIDTKTGTNNYFNVYSVSGSASFELTATNPTDGTTLSSNFNFENTPVVQSAAIPSYMRQGINYDPADPTKVGLAIYAPLKNYVHVIGSFNDWSVNNNYLMKKDTANPNLFWLEITGLTAQQVYTFQYRMNDNVKVADPYSSLVLSPDDDQYITTATYPNKPAYPAGQQFDVSVIQTAKPAYNWQVNNFVKPAKQNLIIYEALVRDFTSERTWQSMIDKLSYLKGLNINAIELMPIMEFDGNNSWGYNTGFHYALDKAYGTPEKFKEFVDKAHQNGIAIILDIALNHATGRSPLVRMWMDDPNSTGYGPVSASNPYFNTSAKHSYSVFEDFNHTKAETKYYVNRVLEQWIKEYKVDGFRWDLTKGFTQECTAGDETCTNGYRADRVAILKSYADNQWTHDPTSLIIFEHLGGDAEEKEWANYKLDENKGIMMWDKLTGQFNQNTMGYDSDSNFNRINYSAHGFSERRNVSYGESHDEERLMYKNITFGAAGANTISAALARQKAYGAVFLTVPGPKMIWEFAELGYDKSIYTCENGTVNNEGDSIPGDCKLDPKQSAFALGYNSDAERQSVYDTWAKILQIRLANQVFDTTTFTVESGNLLPRISIYKDTLPSTSLKNVVVLANFTTSAQNVVPNLPYTGSWYNLINNTQTNFTSTTTPILLQAGEFRILGNQPSTALATEENQVSKNSVRIQLEQNPVVGGNARLKLSNAKNGAIAIYDLSGKLIQTAKAESENGSQIIKLNNLKSGMYLIQLKSENGNAVTKMIVK